MKYILILFFTFSVSAQSTKKLLAFGAVYPWKIEQITDNAITCNYFHFSQNNSSFEIGIVDQEELKDFVLRLKQFAGYYSGIDYDYRSDGYGLNLYKSLNSLYIYDCRENFIKISKANAKILASEIEKSIVLMK